MDDSLAALADEFCKDFDINPNILEKGDINPEASTSRKKCLDLDPQEGTSRGNYLNVDPQEGTSRERYLDVDPQQGTSRKTNLNSDPQEGTTRGRYLAVDPREGTSKGKTIAELPQDDSTCEPPSKKLSKPYCLLVNPKQKGNPILKSISNVPWEYDNIVPDYQMGRTTCALFLSLRYHNLNPDYIHERLKLLGKSYELRVLLVQVDIADPHHALKNLTRICILADMTLILAWSPEEAGKIIETYKIYETKPPDKIMGKSESSSYLKLIQILTTIRSVNKTDAMTLLAKFRTLEGILNASEYQISLCPGFGVRKARKLYTVLHENFCK